MTWLGVAVAAYLILAIVNLLDKFLVESILRNGRVYAFIACVLGLVVFLAAPWLLSWPGWTLWAWDLINGAVFAVALWLLYEALYRGEASRIIVLVGGLTPIFSLFFSLVFFAEQFRPNQWAGLIAILTGIFLIAFLPVGRSFLARVFSRLRLTQEDKWGGLWLAVLSALAYALYFISTKEAYAGQDFASAFIWNRLGAALFVALFLINKDDRRAIGAAFRKSNPGANKLLIIFNQAFGSLGFILQNYAIFLGSVVLVNALQGVQYAFLLVISSILALLAPRLLKETFSARILSHKIAAVLLVALGLYLIAF
ncbi:MAG: EamA family transporter [Patescibacteria group bacterium]